MKKPDLSTILDEYLDSRKNNPSHSDTIFRRKLEILGKNKSEIHEILIELTDEWDNESNYKNDLRAAQRNIISGALITAIVFGVQIFAFFGLKGNNSMIIVSTGIAAGLALMLKGFSERKRAKLTRKRREIKWRSW